MELGWPLPRREDYFRDAVKEAKETHRIRFQGDYHVLKLFSVPIGLPKYRLENGRTVSLQAEWLADHPVEPADLFRQDPESVRAQEIQHLLLTRLIKGADLDAFFSDPANKQTDPVILDAHGFVVNGNRRLCCWRELYYGPESSKFTHFSHVRVIVLPPADSKAIDRLESDLQVAKDIRDDYTWDTLANMMHEKRELHGYSMSQLAEVYPDKKQKEIEELLDMREYAIEYMASRGKPNHWSLVNQHFHAFQKIVEGRPKQTGAAEKKVFEEVAFSLIDKPSDAGQRLYAVIGKAATLMPDIIDRLSDELPEANPVPQENSAKGEDTTGFFDGGSIHSSQTVADSIISSIRGGGNGDTVREVVKDVVAAALEKETEQKNASYVRKKLQRANSEVQNALNGINDKSSKAGVKEQISAIEQGLARIKKWFDANP